MSDQNEYVSALQNYFNFSGRATRRQYWMFVLYNLIITIAVLVVGTSVLHSAALYPLYSLALLIPSISVGVRRMHDAGHSGWWLLVPIVSLVFLCQKSIDADGERSKLSVLAIIGIVFLCLIIPLTGILAAVAIPAYQQYTVQAKMVDVMNVAKQAETDVLDYIQKNGAVPTDMSQTNFKLNSLTVSNVEIDPNTNAIEMTLSFAPVLGKKMLLSPSVRNNVIEWHCSTEDVPFNFRPPTCR